MIAACFHLSIMDRSIHYVLWWMTPEVGVLQPPITTKTKSGVIVTVGFNGTLPMFSTNHQRRVLLGLIASNNIY